jgi:homocysteine S-methyltransferase
MQKSVKLADDARKAYLAEVKAEEETPTKRAFIALSLGPFGSAVSPPQDFDGLYPPPFGPKGPSEDGTGNTRSFLPSSSSSGSDPAVVEAEEKAIEALVRFHLWRLHAVASDPDAWNAVDYVAFETVPHLREVRAIKLAMARFDAEMARGASGGLSKLRGWWISLVFPAGEGSAQWGREERERQTRGLGLNHPDQAEILNVVLDPKVGAVPTGFGLNCTRIDQYPSILSSILSSFKPASGGKIPLTLVVYPNGGRFGDAFNLLTHRWENDGGPRPDGRNITWEEEVVEVVQKCQDQWMDVIVGGCCRVYPTQIERLRKKVNERL